LTQATTLGQNAKNWVLLTSLKTKQALINQNIF